MMRRWCLLALSLVLFQVAQAAQNCSKYYECYDFDEETDTDKWKEEKSKFPAAPDPGTLIPFEVSVANANQFFIDPASISVGKDGVVRYTVVVEASGGARTVNYEGLHCETRERRLYAFGQPDGSWVESQGSSWIPVHKQGHRMLNGYPAVLFDEYFCIDRVPVSGPEAAVERLRYGSAATSARR
jgi:hypothetical protein